jgi:peptide-methionine (S)-S-oxide reductase
MHTVSPVLAAILFAALFPACAQENSMNNSTNPPAPAPNSAPKSSSLPHQFAYFGGGCFWCMEAVFETVPGVTAVVSGYAGGHAVQPSYEDVCRGDTGHAEVIQIEFDPGVVTYEALLQQFWEAHDPTTLNAQGPDEGTQYRSIVLAVDAAQKAAAEQSRTAEQARRKDPITTEIVTLAKFYEAEAYHQDYFRRHPDQAYCRAVIAPKLKKLGKH